MATRTSVTNFTGSKSWSDTSAWQGGVVPTSADIALVRGIRTTVNFSAGYTYWTTPKNFIVSSTSGFPASGSFYCATDRDQKIKIDYTSITNSTTFAGCTVDTSYFAWGTSSTSSGFDRLYGGTIPNGTYVLYQPIIEITGSVTAGEIFIENGGYLKIYDSGSLTFSTNLTTRDGTLHVSGSGQINFGNNNTSTTAGLSNRIYSENYQMSQILFEGNENRLNTTLTQDVAINDGKLHVSDVTGFEVDDFILVKDPNATLLRVDDQWGSDGHYTLKITGSYDEAFQVAGISGSALLVTRMNSIDVPILATSSLSARTIITDSTRLEPGERVVINNDVYTIQSVSDYDFEVRDYDFTTGTTTLDDWETDTNRSQYFSNFQISSSPVSGSAYALIQHASTADRFLFIKDIMRQEVKVEAWISNYRNVTSGTNDGGDLGVVIHADPLMDYDFRFNGNISNSADNSVPFARTTFAVDRDSNRYYLVQRNTSNDTSLSLTVAGIPTNGLKKYTLDCRKGVIKGYIDDVQVSESVMQQGGYFGRVGVTCYTQNSFTCLRYKVYFPAQQIVLDRDITAAPGDRVFESGAQFTHKTGNVVVKQASMVTDPMGHGNLAYGYRGSSDIAGDAIFPYAWNAATNNITSYGRNTSTSFYSLLNNQTVYDINNFNFTAGSTGSIIVDLGAERTVTHVTFQEYYRSQVQYFAPGGYISIRTSNDLTNWTTALSPFNDTRRRISSDALRIYELESPQIARYIQFIRAGNNNTSTVENRWASLDVRDYSDGYKIKLNNISDFNVGDKVIIAYDGGYENAPAESSFFSELIAGTTTSGSYLTHLKDYYEIVSKDSVNKTVTLDRPFTHSFIGKGNRVYKVNKPITISGDRGQGVWKTGRFVIEAGLSNGRHMKIKNAEFTHLTAQYPSAIGTSYSYGNWVHRNYTIHRSDDFEGLSIHSTNASATSYGAIFAYSAGSVFIRDNVFSSWNGRGWLIYQPNYTGACYFAGNTTVQSRFTDVTHNTGISDIYFNYNTWISNSSTYGFYILNYGNSLDRINSNKYSLIRNYFNGGSFAGVRIQQWDNFGDKHAWDIRGNMFEYQDDYMISNLGYLNTSFKNSVLPKRGNTANRLTRFAQFGIIQNYYVPNHIAQGHHENYNNWGYDMCYNSFTWFLKYPNEPFYKSYKLANTGRNATFATTFNVSDDNVSGSFELGFDYFHSPDQIANVGNLYTGSLFIYCIKDGQRFQNDILLPKSSTSTTYNTTINFEGAGSYIIALMQAALTGYVAFDNIYNRLAFTDPNYVTIQTNTFDALQLQKPYPRQYTGFGTYTKNKSGGDNITRINGARLK
jgi:hypothetical protein